MSYKYDVFVSYSRHDQLIVRVLVDRLAQSGLRVFYDEADIAVGDSLVDSLHRAVQEARYVLVVMSPHYFASQWTSRETDLALQQEVDSNRTKVIPVLVQDCEIPPLLRTKIYADFRTQESIEESFPRLLQALKEPPVSPTRKTRKVDAGSPRLGSVTPAVAESAEIREMIEDLRSKVEGFMEGADSKTKVSPGANADVDPKLCFVAMPFGPQELTDV